MRTIVELLCLKAVVKPEVYSTVCSHVVDPYVGWNGADEPDQLLVGVHSDAAVPLGQPARRSEGPEGETNATDSLQFVRSVANVN